MTQDFNPLHLGRESIDVAIDEIKRLKADNEQLKLDNLLMFKDIIDKGE